MHPDISVVYSTHYEDRENRVFENMLRRTSGLPENKVEILRYGNANQYSLSEIYNKGLQSAKSDIILFIHNDTCFLEGGWANVLMQKFANSDFGILGVAGTNKLFREDEKGIWFNSDKRNTAGFIFHPDGRGGMMETEIGVKLDFEVPAVAVDGVFVAVVRDRIKEPFDEDFTGFHFYDISFCVRNFIRDVRIGIIADHSILLYHHSTGGFTEQWEKDRTLFLEKYAGNYEAPVILQIPDKVYYKFEERENRRYIHVIVLAKDKLDDLFQLLESIAALTTYRYYRVWIADTGSATSNKQSIQSKIDELNVEENIQNNRCIYEIGARALDQSRFNFLDIEDFHYSKVNGDCHYSKVNNEIVSILERRKVIGENDFLLFCNDSVRLLNNGIDGCLYEFDELTSGGINVGTMGIRLHYRDNRVRHYGIDLYMREDDRICLSGPYQNYSYCLVDKINHVIGNTAAFLFVRYHTFKEIGRFNELYEDTCQEVEFNLKCLLKGYKNITLGNMIAYQYELQTKDMYSGDFSYSCKDWSQILFPFIIKNPDLIPFFRKHGSLSEKEIYKNVYSLNFAERTVSTSR